jgi:hypothetical protein
MKFIIALIVQDVKRYVANTAMHFDKLLIKINKVNEMAGISVDFMTIFRAFFILFLFIVMCQSEALAWSFAAPDGCTAFAPRHTPLDWLSVPVAVLR